MRINNVGFLNSGRIGLDADMILFDVEVYEGSRFNDEITDESAGGLPKTIRLGDDRLSGARHQGAFHDFRHGRRGRRRGRRVRRRRFSCVDYSRRTKPLFITAGHVVDDDGEAGERDNIVTRDTHINGGSAGDRISANEFSIQPLGISAGAGDDRLEGGAVNDNFDGGPGVDLFVARGGDDHIFARDGVSEVIGCGSGTDVAQIDGNDVTGGCETRNVGKIKLVRKALAAKAGKSVPVELSWTHPRSWTKLRQVELRLLDGRAPVGKVVIAPRAETVKGDGAVKLDGKATRLVSSGKTVTARLALKLDKAFAGRKLGLEVEAVELSGARQIASNAGPIRIAR